MKENAIAFNIDKIINDKPLKNRQKTHLLLFADYRTPTHSTLEWFNTVIPPANDVTDARSYRDSRVRHLYTFKCNVVKRHMTLRFSGGRIILAIHA